MKQRSKRSPKRPSPLPAKPQNARVNIQTRKVLAQHYRAKHGVR